MNDTSGEVRFSPSANSGEDDPWRHGTGYLPLLERDRKTLSEVLRRDLEKLSASKAPTIDEAQGVANVYKWKKLGGILADESARVRDLVKIARDVPDFAAEGDLNWVVRFQRFIRGVTQELWISSSTGKVVAVFPH